MHSIFGKLEDGIGLELLDDRSFGFKLILFNEDGRFMKLKKSAIQELVIEDDLFDMCHTGHLIYKNPHDVLERADKTQLGEEEIDVSPYRFRGDARDFIRFELNPNLDSNLFAGTSNAIDSEFYTLRFTFCIYQVDDMPAESTVQKTKKLLFHDMRIQTLLENDLYWTSGRASIRQKLIAHKKPLSKLSDDDRAIYTGAGIKDMLEQGLGSGVKFSRNWDTGSRKVFYSSPAGSKAYDDILNMTNMHVSSDESENQPCILRLERYTNEWSLQPYSSYFNKSYTKATKTPGVYQNERFYISNEIDQTDTASNPPKSPTSSGSVINNVSFPELSLVSGYVYSEMPGADNQKHIVSSPTHTYHSKNKTFNFLYQEQSIGSMFNFFENNITGNMMGGQSGPYTDFFINNTKSENRNVNLKQSNYNDRIGPLIESRNSVLRHALFNGPVIQFTVKGSTNRRAARFISLDRNDKYTENDFDSKLLGQYLVTNVKHTITQDGYFNNITGVKPYYYNKVNFNTDIT